MGCYFFTNEQRKVLINFKNYATRSTEIEQVILNPNQFTYLINIKLQIKIYLYQTTLMIML